MQLLERVADLNRVKEYRKQRSFTQIELAKKVGVARQTINLIENDKYNPSLSLCIALAKELRTDLNQLFWEENHSEE
ncbi:helix-turn-helix transcriptional regulator [Radiobacillus deserti]|uniref:Helix-turn-helix transcriptional regulator n=1 Tax=Radiobacillus deserti TaxID=2594883 RepID=A0A516KJB9_9BACI|nr:helix-turn-helix transcriptional regulator [Radiobacillus deserti]